MELEKEWEVTGFPRNNENILFIEHISKCSIVGYLILVIHIWSSGSKDLSDVFHSTPIGAEVKCESIFLPVRDPTPGGTPLACPSFHVGIFILEVGCPIFLCSFKGRC